MLLSPYTEGEAETQTIERSCPIALGASGAQPGSGPHSLTWKSEALGQLASLSHPITLNFKFLVYKMGFSLQQTAVEQAQSWALGIIISALHGFWMI